MNDRPEFLFVTCQVGAEKAVKSELARRWPDFRFAYSRPGFLTFRIPAEPRLMTDFDLESIFARAYGFCLGKVTGGDFDELAREVWEVYGERPVRRLHVWPRDAAKPGDHDFEPSITAEAIKAHQAAFRHCPHPEKLAEEAHDPLRPGEKGEFVLDCVMVQTEEWWVGYHRVKSVPSQWPGGMMNLELPEDAVSRAWLKMEEALRWSQLPMSAGAQCVELGSAPGGASQALLSRGLMVTGIDPAEMHPNPLKHPSFTHIRKRALDVRRRQFRKTRWITADMNVDPEYTCDVLESIVTHPEVNVRGMLITLKLLDWRQYDTISQYLERIRGWGYNFVWARQLQYNRQEVCVAALQKPFLRKSVRREY